MKHSFGFPRLFLLFPDVDGRRFADMRRVATKGERDADCMSRNKIFTCVELHIPAA